MGCRVLCRWEHGMVFTELLPGFRSKFCISGCLMSVVVSGRSREKAVMTRFELYHKALYSVGCSSNSVG